MTPEKAKEVLRQVTTEQRPYGAEKAEGPWYWVYPRKLREAAKALLNE